MIEVDEGLNTSDVPNMKWVDILETSDWEDDVVIDDVDRFLFDLETQGA